MGSTTTTSTSRSLHDSMARAHSYDDIETLGICRYSRNSGSVTTSENSRPGSALSTGTVYENVSPLYENINLTRNCEHNLSSDNIDKGDQGTSRFYVDSINDPKNIQPSPKIDYFRRLKQDKKQKNDLSVSIDETSTFAIDQDLETSTCNEVSHSFEEVVESSTCAQQEKSPPPARKRDKPARHSSLLQNFFKRRKSSIELEEGVKHSSLPPGVKGVMTKMQREEALGDEATESEELKSELDSLVEEFQSENEYENMETLALNIPSEPVTSTCLVEEELVTVAQHVKDAEPPCFDTLRKRSLGVIFWSQFNQQFVLPATKSSSSLTSPNVFYTNNLTSLEDISPDKIHFDSLKAKGQRQGRARRKSSFNLPEYAATEEVRRKKSTVKSVYNSLRGATTHHHHHSTRSRRARRASSDTPCIEFDTLSTRRDLYSTSSRVVEPHSTPSYFSLPRRKVIQPDTFLARAAVPTHGGRPAADTVCKQPEVLQTNVDKGLVEPTSSNCENKQKSPMLSVKEDLSTSKRQKGGLTLRWLFRIGRLSLLRPSLKVKSGSEKTSHQPGTARYQVPARVQHVPDSVVADMVSMDTAVASMAEMNSYD